MPKIKDGAYVINLNEYKSIGIRCVALYVNSSSVTYLDSVGVKHIPKEIKKVISNKNITIIQYNYSIMHEYFCIVFIDFMLKGKSLLGYTNLFLSNKYEKNGKIILKYFQ